MDAATVSTPTVAATFDKMLHHLTYMLMIWGVQALVLLIGLFFGFRYRFSGPELERDSINE